MPFAFSSETFAVLCNLCVMMAAKFHLQPQVLIVKSSIIFFSSLQWYGVIHMITGNVIFLKQSLCVFVFVSQLCPTLVDSMDCSPPGSSIHGILQARTPKWVAISFSKSNFYEAHYKFSSTSHCKGSPVA